MLRSRVKSATEKEQVAAKRVQALALSTSTTVTTTSSIDSVLLQRPSADQVNEQWTRALVRKGLALDLVDDVEFRKAVLMTARAGLPYTQTVNDGKVDSKLPRRFKLTKVCVPELDKKLTQKVSKRIDGIIQDTGACSPCCTGCPDFVCACAMIKNRILI